MASDFSHSTASGDDESEPVHYSRTSTNDRRQRQHLHTKRAATIDAETHREKLRIVVLGATKVGKTCLCQQFLQEKFVKDHKETVDELHSIEISLVDHQLFLEILDTAGIDEFPVMRRIAIAHGDAFLIVYSVDDAYSFDMARQMQQLVQEIKGDSMATIPMIIIANKCDIPREKRAIDQEYAEAVVQNQWKAVIVEATCHEYDSVINAFRTVLHLANVNLTYSPNVIRRSSDPTLPTNRAHRSSSHKRQSCVQQ